MRIVEPEVILQVLIFGFSRAILFKEIFYVELKGLTEYIFQHLIAELSSIKVETVAGKMQS